MCGCLFTNIFFLFLGYGNFANKRFENGSFLLEYPGELNDENEAEQREEKYEEAGKGCFMYYFVDGNKQLW